MPTTPVDAPLPPGATVAITGSSGYVGSRLARHFRRQGWRVQGWQRDASRPHPDCDTLTPYTLEGAVAPDALHGIAALVHCAYDFHARDRGDIWRVNVEGTRRLLAAAQAAGVRRTVLISSLSAYDGCRSLYGQAKRTMEQAAISLGGVAVRPGLVFGPQPGGTVGSLMQTVASRRLVPLVGTGHQVQHLAHEDDLCRLVERLCRDDAPQPRPITAASETPHRFREVLQTLAAAQGRRVTLLPLPWRFIWLGLKAAEVGGLRLDLRSDSVLGLVYANRQPDFAPTRRLGVPFREFTMQTLLA